MPENSPVKTPQLLIFDLDGTLIDSRVDLANSVNATLAFLHRRPLPMERISGFIGDGASMLVRRSLEVTGDSSESLMSEAMPFFLEYYREHDLDNTYVYDGVLNTLERLCSFRPDLPMAILTNKPVHPSRRICDGLGISPYMFANYGGDSFATKKPNPEGLHFLIEEANERTGRCITAAETVLIGDSDVDVRTAHAAGARSIGCTYGFAPESLVTASPGALAARPEEWLAALGLEPQ